MKRTLLLPVAAALLVVAAGVACVGIAPTAPHTVAPAPEAHPSAIEDRAAAFVAQHEAVIGAPTGEARWRDDTLVRPFANGTVYASDQGGVGFVTGAIEVAYDAAGGPDRLGVPQGMPVCDTDEPACAQRMERGLVVWSQDEGADVVDGDRTLRLATVPNFRDLAGEGEGLALSDGAVLRRGVVYRAGKLSDLTVRDQAALRALGVTDIYDLRTTSVAQEIPDPTIPGVQWHLSNLYGVDKTTATPVTSAAEAAEHLRDLNRAFVTDPRQREQLGILLRAVAADDGAVLVHCSAGKDRTGWVSAMLQFVAGAEESQVIAEYLKSNEYRADLIERSYATTLEREGRRAAETRRAGHLVDASYLQEGLRAAEQRYGSIQGYLTEGVGLTEAEFDALRTKLRTVP